MIYDIIIIGGGPAGLTAGLYGSRARMKTLIIEKGDAGGQIATTFEVDNYPGSMEKCTGPVLAQRMKDQALSFGTEFVKEEIKKIEKKNEIFYLETDKNKYEAKAVIVATGSLSRDIGCKGEKEFRGMGVSYCATCDGFFFQGLTVVVVGGGDAAIDEGIFLTKFAKKVIIVHRRNELRAAKSLQEKARANPKIEFILDTVVEEIKGNGVVSTVTLKNVKTGELKDISADGVFVFIGYSPNSALVKEFVKTDEIGFIIGDEKMQTLTPGLFVAGDVRRKMLRQVVTAVADGAIAAVSAEAYIDHLSE